MAEYYDHYWQTEAHGATRTGYFPPMVQWLKQELGGDNDLDILEAGCGAAAFTQILKTYSRSLVATDISSFQIAKNQVDHPEIAFEVADLQEKLRFADASFDLIWCSEVLEHLYFPAFALKEFRRVLRPGGRLLMTVPYHGVFKNVLIALFKFEKHYDPEYPHIRFFTSKSLRVLLEKSGFTGTRFATCGMGRPFRDLIVPTNHLVVAK